MISPQDLKDRIDRLSPTAIQFVARILDSLSSPPAASMDRKKTWLTIDPNWVEYFGLALSVHHGMTTDPLRLTGFETVFRDACEFVKWNVEKPFSETHRFVDMTIRRGRNREQRLSLKSTAAQNLSKSTVHISKLTECAWLQDVRSAKKRREKTLKLFQEYTAAVDSIVMLRAFRERDKVPSRYQLLEISTAIFHSLQDAPISSFEKDGPTIDCSFGDHKVAARVSLDRSDSKVTVKQIRLAACTTHVEWESVQ